MRMFSSQESYGNTKTRLSDEMDVRCDKRGVKNDPTRFEPEQLEGKAVLSSIIYLPICGGAGDQTHCAIY